MWISIRYSVSHKTGQRSQHTISLMVFGDLKDEFSIANRFIVALLEVTDPAIKRPGKLGQWMEVQAVHDQSNKIDGADEGAPKPQRRHSGRIL